MGRVYVLLLQENKYYVGYSNNLVKRIEEHYHGNGSVWTQLYPVEKVLQIKNGNKRDEARLTQQMMKIHGVENVRGGPWCAIELYDDPFSYKSYLYSDHINDRCYKCKRKGHFASQCRAIEMLVCHSCNGVGHYSNECYFRIF
jgi:predicted GIY-YIG superfamily endonuclease